MLGRTYGAIGVVTCDAAYIATDIAVADKIDVAAGINNTKISNNTMAWTIPESGDLPPFFTFAAVRAIAPVAGIPPKQPTSKLLVPSAINSVLELCLSLIILSDTTQESKDSIPAKSAIVKALGSRARILSPVISGKLNLGNAEEMV